MAREDAGRQGGGHRAILWLVNGVLAGVGGVFLSTASVVVTAIAAAAAVTIAVTVLMAGRWPKIFVADSTRRGTSVLDLVGPDRRATAQQVDRRDR